MRFALDTTPVKNRITARREANGRKTVGRAVRRVIETLESRQMLASVSAGQMAVFQGPGGQPIRIEIDGSEGSLDFIGATRDENGQPRLNDIPMTIFDRQTGQVIRENLGGFAGRRGVRLADEVLNNDIGNSEFVNPVIDPYDNVPSGRVNLDGLASNSLGKTFGVNRYLAGPGNALVDILRVDSKAGNVQRDAEVSDQIVDQLQTVNSLFTRGDILSVVGADFAPADPNLLYFALNVNFPVSSGGANATITRTPTPAMFTYNLATKQVLIDPNLFGFNNEDDEIRIDDFSFTDDGRIVMFGSVGINGDAEPQIGMFFSDADAIVPGEFQAVRIGEPAEDGTLPEPTTELAAIEVIPGEGYLIAITDADAAGGADDASLVRIDLISGRGRVIGSVVDPDEPTETTSRLGENIRDLAWNPRVVDQVFQPGKRGVLLGAESTRDVLVALDIRERFPNTDLYAIYGNNVRPDLSVMVSEFTPDGDDDLSFNQQLFLGLVNPFGTAGAVRTTMTGGVPVNINLGNGGVYLGIRTRDITQALTVPVLGLSSRSEFAGSRVGVPLPRIVRPGVFINGTMNDMYIAGTVTGSVNINGSIDTFYAGNVITGDPLNGTDNGTDNFFVNGDMRNLIVSGGIGTLAGAPELFAPQTDFLVNGRVQQIKTADGFRGSGDIAGRTSEQSIGNSLRELEYIPDLNLQNRVALAFQGDVTGAFEVVDPVVRNDTFETPQVLGSYVSKSRKRGSQAQVTGVINNGTRFLDNIDFYGVPLLAGQSIQVRLDDLLVPDEIQLVSDESMYLSVIDPDGRIYATDRSNQNDAAFLNQTIQVTADKPGLWRLSVQSAGDTLINADRPYQITVDKMGEIGLGGLVSQGRAFFNRLDLGLRVRTGDLGAILATDTLEGEVLGTVRNGRNQTFNNAITAQTGSIRSLEGLSLGRPRGEGFSNIDNIPSITAPRGSVGLIRGTNFAYFNVNAIGATTREPVPAVVIGGDYQVIESEGDISGVISANGSIGVIRGGSFGSLLDFPGYIQVNADEDDDRAELGLIDVVNDFGSSAEGGPTISVLGENANARYLRVGGFVYRPLGAGSGGLVNSTGIDEAVEVLDDSGATIRITPYNGVPVNSNVIPGGSNSGSNNGIPDPFGGNGNPSSGGSNGIPDPFGGGNVIGGNNDPDDPFGGANDPDIIQPTVPESDILGTLRVAGYPVQPAGLMIYNVSSTTGVAIEVSRAGGGGSGDITNLTTNALGDGTGTGTPTTGGVGVINPTGPLDLVNVKPTQQQTLTLGTGTTLDMIMTGGTVNVFQIGTTEEDPDEPLGGNAFTGGGLSPTNLLNFSRILNNTDGEIVNIRAGDVGFLGAQQLGVSRPVSGVRVEGITNVGDARFPGVGGTVPFNQQRNAIFIDNAIDIQSRGALGNIVIADTVQNIIANSDGVNDRGIFEGIVAPVVQLNTLETLGGIRRVDIGEGLASSGSGDVSFGGLYVSGALGLVTNDNGDGDIRGDIVAGRYFEGIRLGGGGSIINADIIQGANISTDTGTLNGTAARFDLASELNVALLDLRTNPTSRQQLNGIGDIRMSGNGGMINTVVSGYNMGRIVVADAGFGVLNSLIRSSGGARMDGMSVGGLGIRNVTYTGGSAIGDIVATGKGSLVDVRNLSRSVRVRESGYFDPTGIAPNEAIDVNLLLGTSSKQTKIEGVSNSGVLQDTTITAARSINAVRAFEIRGVNSGGARPRDEAYPMQINFANSIGEITAGRNINGARITGGTVNKISAGRDITQFQFEGRARVKAITAGRNILGTANINMGGSGSLDLLQVGGNMNGTGYVPRGIRSIIVGGDIRSARDQGGLRSGTDINLLQIGGDVRENAYIRANRTIKAIDIGGDIQANATIRAVNFGTITIDGEEEGNIIRG